MPDAGVRLWNECSFLVLDRPGYEIPEHLPPNFTELTALAGSTIVTEEVASPLYLPYISPVSPLYLP